MALTQYAIAAGHNVALVSLLNVEDLLYTYTKPRRVPPKSQPVNAYPFRRVALGGRTYGDGQISHAWLWDVLPRTAIDFLNTYTVGVVSAAVTIYTRATPTTFARYNAYITMLEPGITYTDDRGKAINITLNFTELVAL